MRYYTCLNCRRFTHANGRYFTEAECAAHEVECARVQSFLGLEDIWRNWERPNWLRMTKEIVYDPDKKNTVIEEDKQWIDVFAVNPKFDTKYAGPYVLRIKFTELYIHDLVEKLKRMFPKCHVICTDGKIENPIVIRVRLTNPPDENDC